MENLASGSPFGIATDGGGIETERLWIRPAAPGDGAVFNAAITGSLDYL